MWVLLVLLLLEGVFCLLVGITRDSLGATVSTLEPAGGLGVWRPRGQLEWQPCSPGACRAACPSLPRLSAVQLATLFACSFFGQMACGAVFGIVPFASHRSSGLTVGLVAAGGNVGSAVMQVCARVCRLLLLLLLPSYAVCSSA
jgi:nitrate/nitrite transporter NarK